MNIGEVIKSILKLENLSIKALSKRISAPYTRITNRLNQNDMTIGKANELLRPLDYKLVIVPADKKLKENEYEVE